MLFKLGLKNLRHDKFINLLIILQMTIVFFITISMVSTIVSRFQYYDPFRKQFNNKGIFCCFRNALDPETGDARLKPAERLHELLENDQKIIASYSPWLYCGDEEVSFASYDDEFIEMYEPEIESGKWFDLNVNEGSAVPIVVSQNPYGFKVGDKIQINIFSDNNDDILETEVVGILKEGTKVIGFSNSESGQYDCRNAFVNYNYGIEQVPLFILRQKDLENKPIMVQMNGPAFITYSSDTADEVIESNNEIIRKMGILNITPLDEMKSNSMDYIFSQIYTLLPILICILILTLVGAVSVSALSAKRQLKNYAIYYICGLKWRQCASINFFSALISISLSFILSIVSVAAIELTGLLKKTVIEFGVWQILSCIVIMIIYIILSVVLPISIIGKNTPNQVLKSN